MFSEFSYKKLVHSLKISSPRLEEEDYEEEEEEEKAKMESGRKFLLCRHAVKANRIKESTT